MSNFHGYYRALLSFFRSADFSRAIVLSISIGLPVLLAHLLGRIEIGMALAMGCLLSSPSDIEGSFKHRFLGMIFAAILAGLVSMIIGYSQEKIWILLPVMGLLMFGISFLAVFGLRASLVAFSGLFAMVLSFTELSDLLAIWQKGLLISLGGCWYLGLRMMGYFLNPKGPTEELLARTLELTGRYLKTRAGMFSEKENRGALQKDLLSLQQQLNEKHETLRDVLIRSRLGSGNSNFVRKQLLVLIELIDMLELAIAHPVDYPYLDRLIQENPDFFLRLKTQTDRLADKLLRMSGLLERQARYSPREIREQIRSTEEGLRKLREHIPWQDRETRFILEELCDYLERQGQKISAIIRTLFDLRETSRLIPHPKEMNLFITPRDYDPRVLRENFTAHSPIFRHAARLSVVVLIGFSIGAVLSLDNAYWILLTIVVIMRPTYGLTKQRSRQRIFGTLIGATIAIGIVFLIYNPFVYAVLGLITLTLAFSLIQRNYKAAAVFVTLSIVFIYALLEPDVYQVIQFRIIDTLIGAGLAALGNAVLWPAWEADQIKETIGRTIACNRNYLLEIGNFYQEKGKLPVSYKLARKKAFLETGNFNAAFQRMTQEPRSQQKELEAIFQLLGLNQTFLGALASLGTYIRTHPTTPASEHFQVLIESIRSNLEHTESLLKHRESQEQPDKKEILKAGEALEKAFEDLLQEMEAEEKPDQEELALRLQEAHLVRNQLKWLLELSERIKKSTYELSPT